MLIGSARPWGRLGVLCLFGQLACSGAAFGHGEESPGLRSKAGTAWKASGVFTFAKFLESSGGRLKGMSAVSWMRSPSDPKGKDLNPDDVLMRLGAIACTDALRKEIEELRVERAKLKNRIDKAFDKAMGFYPGLANLGRIADDTFFFGQLNKQAGLGDEFKTLVNDTEAWIARLKKVGLQIDRECASLPNPGSRNCSCKISCEYRGGGVKPYDWGGPTLVNTRIGAACGSSGTLPATANENNSLCAPTWLWQHPQDGAGGKLNALLSLIKYSCGREGTAP